MDIQLLQLLEQTGFTKKEAQIYLALLELGSGRVSELAKKTELKRPIIYVVLESLVKRGYASELPDSKINTFQATDPTTILNKIQITTKNLSEMIPVLRSLANKGKSRPKITYHETREGIWNIYEEMNRAKEPFFISNYQLIEKYFPGSIKKWINDVRKGIYTLKGKHLIPGSLENIKIGKEFLKINQSVRVLKSLHEIKMDFTIWNNKLGITSLEKDPFIVMIESEELVKSIRPLFELAWKSGKNIN